MVLLFKGFFVGALIAIPVGPVGLLCLKRLLTQGTKMGIASGIGGATADAIFASIAIVGLSLISSFIKAHMHFMRLASSIFLCIVGIHLVFNDPITQTVKPTSKNIIHAYFSTLLLTLANPFVILSSAALFSVFSINTQLLDTQQVTLLLLGIFLGSTIWWFLLGGLTTFLKLSFKAHNLKKINLLTGTAIITIALINLFYSMVSNALFK